MALTLGWVWTVRQSPRSSPNGRVTSEWLPMLICWNRSKEASRSTRPSQSEVKDEFHGQKRAQK